MAYGTVNADLITDSNGGKFSPVSSVFRNRIINGDMRIDQRNAGASVTPTVDATYVLDRWATGLSVASKFSVQQNAASVTPPTGFSNYLGATSLATTSLGATDYYLIYQKIEGFNTADLNWGTANAKTVTLSFQVYSSLTGTFGGSLANSAQSRNYPFSFTVSTANTWTSVSVTIAGDTTGTWIGATNGTGMIVRFSLGTGTTYSGTANAWTGSSFIFAPTGATSVVGTNGATFYVTGVQLEIGSQATSFDFRDYGRELILCQRYYEKDTEGAGIFSGNFTNGSTYYYMYYYKVTKRTSATPTITTAVSGFNTPTVHVSALNGFRIISTGASDGSGGYFLAATWNVSAEL